MKPFDEREILSFPKWAELLARTDWPSRQRNRYHDAIVAFLRHCNLKTADHGGRAAAPHGGQWTGRQTAGLKPEA